MGQAKRRGTFEERKQQAIERNNKKYAAQMLVINSVRKDLEENKDDIRPVLKRHSPKLVLALAAALSTSTGIQFHMPQTKENEK